MQPLTRAHIAATVESVILEHASRHQAQAGAIGADQSILEFVDSFGLVNVIMDVESRLGVTIDLAEVDLGELVRFASFVSFLVATCAAAGHTARA
jgi:acyl carrier protein